MRRFPIPKPTPPPKPPQRKIDGLEKEIAKEIAECYYTDGVQAVLKFLRARLEYKKLELYKFKEEYFVPKRSEIECMIHLLRDLDEIKELANKDEEE